MARLKLSQCLCLFVVCYLSNVSQQHRFCSSGTRHSITEIARIQAVGAETGTTDITGMARY